GKLHHDCDELEHHLHQSLGEAKDGLLRSPFDLREREGEQRGPEDNLQHLAVCRSLDEAPGYDMFEESGKGGGSRLRDGGVWVRRWKTHAEPGFHEVPGE